MTLLTASGPHIHPRPPAFRRLGIYCAIPSVYAGLIASGEVEFGGAHPAGAWIMG